MIPDGTELGGTDTGKSKWKEQEEDIVATLVAKGYLVFFAVIKREIRGCLSNCYAHNFFRNNK
jgi:hypothetical protein